MRVELTRRPPLPHPSLPGQLRLQSGWGRELLARRLTGAGRRLVRVAVAGGADAGSAARRALEFIFFDVAAEAQTAAYAAATAARRGGAARGDAPLRGKPLEQRGAAARARAATAAAAAADGGLDLSSLGGGGGGRRRARRRKKKASSALRGSVVVRLVVSVAAS